MEKQYIQIPKGNFLERHTVDELQPYLFHYQLTNDGRMPDTLMGEKTDLTAIAQEFFYNNIESYMYTRPTMACIYCLNHNRVVWVLNTPRIFRLRQTEFINCHTNKVNKEKKPGVYSGHGRGRICVSGTKSSWNSLDFKSIDDGNFLTDSNGELYHLKMVKERTVFCQNSPYHKTWLSNT